MKTKLLALSIIFSFAMDLFAQTPEWQWSKRVGGSEMEDGRAVQADASGNIYVTGLYRSSTITIGTITLTGTASQNIFLAKYDAAGNVIWAKTSEGTGTISANTMAIDPDGNILIGGTFGSLSLIFGFTTLTSIGSDDAFLVKYDPDGNVLWAKSAGSTAVDRFLSIACDALGNTYATGNFSGTSLNFGSTTLTNPTNGWLYSFVVKYDANGETIWVSSMGGEGQDWGRAIAVDNNGDVIVAGEHSSDTFSLGSLSITNEGGPDIFIAKLDSDGNAIWLKSGVADNATCQAIAVDSNNQIYITGSFYNETIVFDNITLNNTGQLTYSEFFLAKFDANGNTAWAKSSQGDEQEEGRALAFDASDNICVAGFFISPTATFENTTLENAGLDDSFVAKYDPDGDMFWAIAIGAANSDYIEEMASDNLGNLYVTGFFNSSALAFGDYSIYTSNSDWDFFIAKLGDGVNFIDNTSADSMNIFPNPFSEHCTIQFSKPLSNGSVILENTLGQRVLELNNINGSSISLGRNDLQSGTYFMRFLESEKMVGNGKLVMMK